MIWPLPTSPGMSLVICCISGCSGHIDLLFISSVSLHSLHCHHPLDKLICRRFLHFNGLSKNLPHWLIGLLLHWLTDSFIHSVSQSTTLRYSTLGLERCTWSCDWPMLWLEREHSTWVSNSMDPELLPRINPVLKAPGQCRLVVKSMASEVRLPAFECSLCHYWCELGQVSLLSSISPSLFIIW